MIRISDNKKIIPLLIVADLLLTVLAKLLHGVFTVYELLFIFYEFGCLLVFLYTLITGKAKLRIMPLLELSCFMLFGIAAYSTLTYGQASIHGDTAIATLLSQAELKYRSLLPRSWVYANGDLWILDTQLATLPFTLILKNQSLARMLGTLVMMILGALGLYLLDRYLLHSGSHLISIPVLFVFFFGGNYTLMWGNDHIIYQASYTCWLFLIPAILILTYHVISNDVIKESKGRIYLAIYLIFAVICYARGVRAAAELMIPVAGASLLLGQIRDPKLITKKKLFDMALVFIPMILGLLIYKAILATHIVNISSTSSAVFVASQEEMLTNLVTAFRNLFNIFGFNKGVAAASVEGLADLVAIFCCLLFVFVFPALEISKLREEEEGFVFFFIFAMIHNGLMLIATICFSGKTSPSHILSFVLVSVMLSSHYVMKHLMTVKDTGKIFCILFLIASLIMGSQLALKSRGWTGKLADRRYAAEVLMEHGLSDYMGYGTFWNIYPLSIYSNLKLDVAAIGYSDLAVGLTPHANLVDINKYSPQPDKKGAYILLNYNENEELGGTLESVIGECSEKFTIGEDHIYVWDHDICSYLE